MAQLAGKALLAAAVVQSKTILPEHIYQASKEL
jgi:hypothetical protein